VYQLRRFLGWRFISAAPDAAWSVGAIGQGNRWKWDSTYLSTERAWRTDPASPVRKLVGAESLVGKLHRTTDSYSHWVRDRIAKESKFHYRQKQLDTWFIYLIWTGFSVVYSVFCIVLWHVLLFVTVFLQCIVPFIFLVLYCVCLWCTCCYPKWGFSVLFPQL
jgi:hypothetical protein